MRGRSFVHPISLRVAVLVLFGVWQSAAPGALSGQTTDIRYYTLVEGSRLTISGSTNVNRFQCNTDDLKGGAALATNVYGQGMAPGDTAVLAAEVDAFRCDVLRVERDLVRALRGDGEHDVHFEMRTATLLSEPPGHMGWHEVLVEGDLQLGGVWQPISLMARIQDLGGERYQVKGSTEVRMSDFDIKPPVALLGLVRARDEIEVAFDLRAARSAAAPEHLLESRSSGNEP